VVVLGQFSFVATWIYWKQDGKWYIRVMLYLAVVVAITVTYIKVYIVLYLNVLASYSTSIVRILQCSVANKTTIGEWK